MNGDGVEAGCGSECTGGVVSGMSVGKCQSCRVFREI